MAKYPNLGVFLSNSASIGTASSGRVSEVAAIGRCQLRQVPLIMAHLGGLLRGRFQGVTYLQDSVEPALKQDQN